MTGNTYRDGHRDEHTAAKEATEGKDNHTNHYIDPASGHYIHTLEAKDLPSYLTETGDAPKRLFVRTAKLDQYKQLMAKPRVAIVGSRNATIYGEQMTRKFASELAAHGVVIVSGLAIGIDGIAHRAALDVGGLTMAVLPSSVTNVYPASHSGLADDIVNNGGILISEYASESIPFKTNFIVRNRLVSGLSQAVLIPEATRDSGTMHTATFANNQSIDVMAVPGNITSELSEGTNNLIKRNRAAPVTTTADVLHVLEIEPTSDDGSRAVRVKGSNEGEQAILDLLEQGVYQGSELLERSGLDIRKFNQHLTMLEITAKIRPLGGNRWGLQ